MPNTSSTSTKTIALNPLSMPCTAGIHRALTEEKSTANQIFQSTPLTKTHNNLLDATCSAIFSHALNMVLPIGTVEVKSVQHVFSEADCGNIDEKDKAVSISATSLSPGKFINSANYGDLNVANKRLETYRIRQAFSDLNSAFGTEQKFTQFITRTLDNCANQTAYAYVHQIGLGSITPEDITIDGKWVGLANAGLQVTPEINGSAATSLNNGHDWQQEHTDLSSIYIKWVCYYNSFNQTQINTDTLIDFYNDKFNQYLEKYSVEFIGYESSVASFADLKAEKRFLVKLIKAIYNRAQHSDSLKPITLKQILLAEISAFYCCSNSGEPKVASPNCDATTCQINEGRFPDFSSSHAQTVSKKQTVDTSTRQSRLIETMREFYNSPFTHSAQSIACAIKAFRKVIFSDALSNSVVKGVITQKLATSGTQDLEKLTNKYRELACWLFNRLDSSVHVILFVNSFVKCFFVPVTHSFVYENFKNGDRYSFMNLPDLMEYLSRQPQLDFYLPGVDGWQRLEQLIRLLLNVEQANR